MKIATWMLAAAIVTQVAAAESRFAGTWRGSMNGLPAVTLIVKDEGGQLSGTIQFFLQVRDTETAPWRASGSPEGVSPLITPAEEGARLSFEAWHHTCHECKEWGPNVPLTVEWLESGRLKLGDVILTKE